MPFFSLAATVDYGGGPVVDTDLDGLTDRGEEQIFHTNPLLPDTDGDGLYDGVEVLAGEDPLVPFGQIDPSEADFTEPLSWWISRASGLIAYALLWATVVLGFSFRTPFLRDVVAPIYKLDLHKFLALTATAFVLLHIGSLLFDEYLDLSAADILQPFHLQSDVLDTAAVAAGILAFYGIVVLIVTSLLPRRYFSYGLWRAIHFIHVFVLFLTVIHILQLGTDVAEPLPRALFLTSVVILTLVYPAGLFFVIRDMWRLRRRKKLSDRSANRVS